jgi:hypothetical protein
MRADCALTSREMVARGYTEDEIKRRTLADDINDAVESEDFEVERARLAKVWSMCTAQKSSGRSLSFVVSQLLSWAWSGKRTWFPGTFCSSTLRGSTSSSRPVPDRGGVMEWRMAW